MRGWIWVLLVALAFGQTPAVGWREAFAKPRCSVAVCQCRDCGGGIHCCCAQVETPLERALTLIQCDRAEQEQLALTVTPRVVPTPELLIPMPRFAFARLEQDTLQPPSQTLTPRSPPPRHSFRLG